jgi:hypothetical protein
MIDNQTIEQLRSLRLDGMLAALNDPATAIATSELSFEQRACSCNERLTGVTASGLPV